MSQLFHDPVNHPTHYTRLGDYSPLHVIEAWNANYHLGQVLKYIGRAGHKDGASEIEDLRKAAVYLNRHIRNVEAGR